MDLTGVDGIGSRGGTDNPLLTYVSNNNPAIPQQAEGAKGGTQADGWNPNPSAGMLAPGRAAQALPSKAALAASRPHNSLLSPHFSGRDR